MTVRHGRVHSIVHFHAMWLATRVVLLYHRPSSHVSGGVILKEFVTQMMVVYKIRISSLSYLVVFLLMLQALLRYQLLNDLLLRLFRWCNCCYLILVILIFTFKYLFMLFH